MPYLSVGNNGNSEIWRCADIIPTYTATISKSKSKNVLAMGFNEALLLIKGSNFSSVD